MDDHIQQLRLQNKMFWDAFQKAANEIEILRQQNAELALLARGATNQIAFSGNAEEAKKFHAMIDKATGGE